MSQPLQFVHASVAAAQIPFPVRKWLGPQWQVKRSELDALSTWKTLPAFTWVDLGKIGNPNAYASYWNALAGLQQKSPDASRIFISGLASSPALHEQVLHDVFDVLDPMNVDVDLAGHPDVVAALAKFEAVRREPGATKSVEAVREKRRDAPQSLHVPNADLRVESGKLSAKNIAAVFGVTLTELGEWIDRKKAALSKTPDSESIQPLLDPLAQIAFYRNALGDDATFRKWLRTEHELLEQKSPLHWIKAGKIREVAEFVEDALTGQPT
jgi:hypothetical protein